MTRSSSLSWKPSIAIILIAGLLIALVALVGSYMYSSFKPTTEVRINTGLYQLDLADTDAELAKGLSGVESLAPNGGLLMQFPSDDTWGIWMKDMRIPLDIIWLDKDKKVVYIQQNVSPELGTETTFRPEDPARYVLELKAGSVKNAAIKTGQQAYFTIEGDKK